MITIKKCNKEINRILGTQEYDCHLKYRHILFLIEEEVKTGYLVQNTLTREMILFTKTEYDLFKKMELEQEKIRKLIMNWFFIPERMNEKSIYYLVFQKHIQNRQKLGLNRKNTFTIFTTTSCNARCPYCYERGIKNSTMSSETALDVAKYIDVNRIHNMKIHLKWFGGEPLVNGKTINDICDYLIKSGVDFYSNMTSNGYLFDQYSNEEIKDIWHLERVQITLDGTKEVYQNTKNYVNGDKHAFEKVIQNIKRLLNIGVKVTIRMNISADNGDDLLSLISYLKYEFDGNRNLKIYSYVLFDECDPNKKQMSDDERKIACEFYKQIETKIVDSGFGIYGFDFPSVHTSHCMADNGTSICITPNGNITLCEHHTEDEIVGNIYEGIFNYNIMREWTERLEYSEKCDICEFYPQCITLKKCPSFVNGCDEFFRIRKKISAKFTMKNAYNKYLCEAKLCEK